MNVEQKKTYPCFILTGAKMAESVRTVTSLEKDYFLEYLLPILSKLLLSQLWSSSFHFTFMDIWWYKKN